MKANRVFKSILSIICTVILILSAVFVPAVSGAETEPVSNLLTFENYPYKAPTGNSSINTVVIEEKEGVGMDDNYALHFKLDTDDSYVDTKGATVSMGSRISQREHCAVIGSVTSGNIYRVTYYYKTTAETTARYNIFLSTASPTNIWSNYAKITSTEQQVAKDESDWTKVTTIFTAAPTTEKANGLYLHFTFSTSKANNMADVYVDNVTVEEFGGSVVLFHSNTEGIDDIIVSGNAGEAISLPTMTNGRNPLLGWYLDKECTTPFTATAFTEGITHVYALWGDGPLTFEDYPYNTVASTSFGRTMSVVNQTGIGNDDDYALRFKFDGDEVYSVTQEPVKDENGNEVKDENGNVVTKEVTTYMSSRAAQRDHVATLGKVKDNTVYKVSYYIRSGENCETAYSTVLATAHKDNIWASYTVYSNTKVYYTADNSEWTKVTLYFQTKLAKADGSTLFVIFNSSNSTKEAYAEAYLDYVEIEELSGSVIFFHPNVGAMEDVVINGETGSAFDYPELKNGRSEITGWFKDQECTTSFTGNTFPEGITHLYAKWSDAPLTFEDYPYSTTLSGVFGVRTMSIYESVGFGYDDDYALRFKFDGDEVYSVTQEPVKDENGNEVKDENGNTVTEKVTTYMSTRAAQRDHIATVGKIKKGAAYKVSYYYKSGNNCETSYTLHLAASINSNIWGNNFTQFSATRVTGSASTKDWTKVSFIIDTSVIADSADTLYIKFNSSNATTDAFVDAYVDHFVIEEIETPFILVNANNSTELQIVQGKVGDTISLPEVTRHGYTFAGWYTDTELTNKFEEKNFTDGMNVNVYAKWTKHTSVTYDFESFDIPSFEESGYFLRENSEQYKTSAAFSGNHVIKFDRTGEYNAHSSWMPIADGNELFQVEKGKKYAVSVNYYVAKEMDEKKNITVRLKTATSNNYWGSGYSFNDQQKSISSTTKVGRWNNLVFLIDAKDINENGTSLYLFIQGGKGGIVYFDDILITEVPDGYGVVGIQKENCTNISPFVMGKIGTNYYSKLNQNAKVSGKYFKGYFALSNGAWEALNKEKTVFTKELITLSARFIDYKIIQDFEGVYRENSLEWESYTFYDFDYEIYDSKAEGNSADNVTSGRYSLHRKGDSMFFENASIITWGEEIAEGERYTVTFKVKMGKHAHTDGAIKIASGKSFRYQWTTSGSYYPVVAIEDLTDGNWHEVSYTFNSVEAYVIIQTPGHVELFIDDIEFKLVDDITPLSFPVNYTEYVPAELDEAGNLIYDNAYAIDVSTIIDESLYEKDGFFGSAMMYIIIGIAAVIIIGGAVVLLIIKKKKAKA